MTIDDDSTKPFKETRETCADPIDDASATGMRVRENEIALQRAKAQPEQRKVMGADGFEYWPITECVDCGDDIPPARLELARIRCVICQSIKEKKESLHGRFC